MVAGNRSNNNSSSSRQGNAKPRTSRRGVVKSNNRNRKLVKKQYPKRTRPNYATNNNLSMSNKYKQLKINAPLGLGYNVENSQNSTITIRRVGFLTNVVAAVSFKIGAFNMHPSILPWIKTLSRLYDKYKFINFSVRYMGQCASNTTGTIFLAYDYDPHKPLPDNLWKTQAYDKFVSCPVWGTSSWVSVTRNILTDKWYDCDTSSDNKNADSWHDRFPGRIIFGTYGGSNMSGINVGQLEISYTVRLSRPSFNDDESAPVADVSFTSNLDTVPPTGGIESIDRPDVDASSQYSVI